MTEYLEPNGARIAHDVHGEGEPIVLVHAGVANRGMWDDQVEALRDAYRVIRHDTRGSGETETEAVPFSNRAGIGALLDHLGAFDDPGTVDSMRHLAASVPGAQLEEFESAHMVNLEHPERFNRVLREFLDAHRQG